MTNLDNLSPSQAEELLKKLKLYKSLTKNLWNRGKKLFKNIVENKHSYKVEYFPSFWEQEAINESLKVFKEVFKEEIDPSILEVIKKDSLKWWIKVFKDDNLVDLSFSKTEKIFS